MEYKVNFLANNKVEILFNVSGTEWEGFLDLAFTKNKESFNVKGFRKDKLTRSLLEQKHGKDFFYSAGAEIAVNKYYFEVLKKETTLVPLLAHSFKIISFSATGCQFSVNFLNRQPLKLAPYKGLTLVKKIAPVTEADIERELSYLQYKHSTRNAVAPRPVKDGDLVEIDYSGFIDGKKVDKCCGEKQLTVIGSKTYIPGFEEGLIGLTPEAETTLDLVFPEDYYVKEFQKKKVQFTIKLRTIFEVSYPELTDEFIQKNYQYPTLADYKAFLREVLMTRRQQEASQKLEQEILTKLVAESTIEIPEELLAEQLDLMLETCRTQFASKQLSFDEYLKSQSKNETEYRQELIPQAKDIIAQQLVIMQLLDNEKITISGAEIEEHLASLAQKTQKSLSEFKAQLNQKMVVALKNELLFKKLFHRLAEYNTIKEEYETTEAAC